MKKALIALSKLRLGVDTELLGPSATNIVSKEQETAVPLRKAYQ